MSTLPVLVSIPHGGLEIPSEVRGLVALGPGDVFEDADACTPEIYDLADAVAAVTCARVARAVVDLNRAPDDLPPANPDGVVKTTTCYGKPVWRDSRQPTPRLTRRLLEAHHYPYHRLLAARSADPGLRLGVDCHSMAATPPPVAPDAGRRRPTFCLSNAGGLTCSESTLNALGAAIAAAFDLDPEEIAFNDPFTGGYITRTHGAGPLPWIQVEMNRRLYLAPPWYEEGQRRVDPARLLELRERFREALEVAVGHR